MKVFIHLGIHKTASTFIQNNIFINLKSTKFLDRKEMVEFKRYVLYTDDFKFSKEHARFLFDKVVKKHSIINNFIISDEEFYGNPYMGAIDRKRNIDRLLEIFSNEAYFLIFIRNQVKLLLSLYSYYVKSGGTADINNFMYYKKFPLLLNEGYFEYDAYLNYIREKAPKNHLKVILFENFVNSKQQTINDVFNYLEEPLLHIELNKKKTNKSLSYSLLNTVRFINMFIKSSKQPFLLLPKKTHGLTRKFFESFEVKDTNAKNKLLTSINNNDEFMVSIKESNKRLMATFEELNIKGHNYPLS